MTIREIMNADAANGGHYFSPDTMRFFASRVCSDTFPSSNGLFVYFVTSEKFRSMSGADGARLYTVRAWRTALKDVETIGEFQQFHTRAQAIAAAKRLAGSRWQPISPTPAEGTGPKCGETVADGRSCWRRATHANLSDEPFAPQSYRCCEHLPGLA